MLFNLSVRHPKHLRISIIFLRQISGHCPWVPGKSYGPFKPSYLIPSDYNMHSSADMIIIRIFRFRQVHLDLTSGMSASREVRNADVDQVPGVYE